jgi:hypothetical protein
MVKIIILPFRGLGDYHSFLPYKGRMMCSIITQEGLKNAFCMEYTIIFAPQQMYVMSQFNPGHTIYIYMIHTLCEVLNYHLLYVI